VPGLLAAQEGLDDAHGAAAARARMLGCLWLFGRGVECLDGIDGDKRRREQFTDACDIAGAGLAGEEAVVADAVSADSAFANVRRLSPESAKTPKLRDLLRHIPSATVRLCPETFGASY
jgi:hypothetical protein